MTVSELIDKLKEMDQNADVYLSNEHEGCYGTYLNHDCVIEEEGRYGEKLVGLYQFTPRDRN